MRALTPEEVKFVENAILVMQKTKTQIVESPFFGVFLAMHGLVSYENQEERVNLIPNNYKEILNVFFMGQLVQAGVCRVDELPVFMKAREIGKLTNDLYYGNPAEQYFGNKDAMFEILKALSFAEPIPDLSQLPDQRSDDQQ